MNKTISVTSARQQLLKLTKDIGRRMDQVVLTNKGEAQAVLLSMGEYNSLRAAAELASHPEVRSASEEGFEQLRRGEGATLAEAMPGPAGARKRSSASQRLRRT
ncbi:MAG: type II toxin-antitoxin system Phd/YefM family antitoxin [Candidatus Korobacteraceae bacterium]